MLACLCYHHLAIAVPRHCSSSNQFVLIKGCISIDLDPSLFRCFPSGSRCCSLWIWLYFHAKELLHHPGDIPNSCLHPPLFLAMCASISPAQRDQAPQIKKAFWSFEQTFPISKSVIHVSGCRSGSLIPFISLKAHQNLWQKYILSWQDTYPPPHGRNPHRSFPLQCAFI